MRSAGSSAAATGTTLRYDDGVVNASGLVLGADGVCVIEWGEQFADELGDYVSVRVTRLDDEAEPGQEPPRAIDVE